MATPPDPLDHLLNQWSETPDPAPRLADEVWRRIAIAESEAEAPAAGWRRFDEWFGRPSFAAMFVAACALLGLFLAEVRVSHLQRERSAQLARSYLMLIDPLLNTPDNSHHP